MTNFWEALEIENAKKKEKKIAFQRKRRLGLSAPIPTSRILEFTRHLIAVNFVPGEECWPYVSFGRGKDATCPKDLVLSTRGYRTMTVNCASGVQTHRFAYAVSQGIPLIELTGYEVHHTVEVGCFGSVCNNPDHLEAIEKRTHWSMHGPVDTVNPRHIAMVEEIYRTAPVDRQLPDYRAVTGAARARRFLAGMPFLIKTAQWHIPADAVKIEEQLSLIY